MALLIVIVGGVVLAFGLIGIIGIIGKDNANTKTSEYGSAVMELAEMLAKECEDACKERDMKKAQFCVDMLDLLS